MNNTQDTLEEKFLEALLHHISGWHTKVLEDFGKESYELELQKLKNDPVYSKFGFDTPEYVLIRLMGRLSISIGRRLGEIYDKVPRLVTAARFGLSVEKVSPKFGGLELDIGIMYKDLSEDDHKAVNAIVSKYFIDFSDAEGVGIEIRYNFNPNDSARLRKDVRMASLLIEENLFPVYLIFSEISPRQEAIARLERAGWHFLVGKEAERFMNDLVGMNFSEILDRPTVQSKIREEINKLMNSLLESEAFERGARLKQ